MNIYFRSFSVSASILLMQTLCPMDQQQALVPMKQGMFHRLDKHKKPPLLSHNKLIFM